MSRRRHIGPRERLAIFEAAGGRCHLCGDKIDGTAQRWEVEHVVPLELGGDETKGSGNLQPAHVGCHRVKTTADAGRIAKAKRVEARHKGARRSSRQLPGGKGSAWKHKIGVGWVRREDDG